MNHSCCSSCCHYLVHRIVASYAVAVADAIFSMHIDTCGSLQHVVSFRFQRNTEQGTAGDSCNTTEHVVVRSPDAGGSLQWPL